jgi:hypothetical protein
MASKNGLKPTSAAEWRKPREEGIIIPLLSGRYARIRPVALDSLIAAGEFPDLLTNLAASTMFKEETVETISQGDMAKNYSDMINIVVPAAFVEPRVAPDGREPSEDEISLDDIDFADKVTVFNLATSGARALEIFRDQQKRNVQDLPDGQDDGKPRKRTVRRKG